MSSDSGISISSPIDYSNSNQIKIDDDEEDDDISCGSSTNSTQIEPNEVCGDNGNKLLTESGNNAIENGKKRDPKCARCQNHNIFVKVKGHKRKCEYRDCECELCMLTIQRRVLMAKTISVKRQQKEDLEDNNFKPPEPVFKKLRTDEDINQSNTHTHAVQSMDCLSESLLQKLKAKIKHVFLVMEDMFELRPNWSNKVQDAIRRMAQRDGGDVEISEINDTLIQALRDIETRDQFAINSAHSTLGNSVPSAASSNIISQNESNCRSVLNSSLMRSSPPQRLIHPVPVYTRQYMNGHLEVPSVQNNYPHYAFKNDHQYVSQPLLSQEMDVYKYPFSYLPIDHHHPLTLRVASNSMGSNARTAFDNKNSNTGTSFPSSNINRSSLSLSPSTKMNIKRHFIQKFTSSHASNTE